jgi:2-methylcitrate dehydratase PrpD
MVELTRRLADWAAKTTYEDLPLPVKEKAKCCMLDCSGVMLAAVKSEVGQIFRTLLPELGGPGPCSVLGSRKRWKPMTAGLVNGSLAHALDYDDTYQPIPAHTSASVFPAALAAGESKSSSGKDLVRAMAVGTEVAIRIGLALGRSHIERGWHGTGTFNTFGAAVAAGILFGLSADQMTRCLGTAAVQAAGLLRAAAGTKCKPLHAGKAAMNGILSGVLAAFPSWTAPEKVLEMEQGFGSAFSDKPQMEVGLDGLGEKYLLMGISFKLYASCSQTHATIDGVSQLRKQHQIDPEAVQEIVLAINPIAATVAGIMDPKDGLQGKFSVAYCAALALYGYDPFEDAFSDAMVRRPELQAAWRKVKLEVITGRGDVESEIEIRLKSGGKFSTYIPVAKGNPGNELSSEELTGKFHRLVGPFFGPRSTNRLQKMLLDCQGIKDARDLGNLLRRASLKALAAKG